MPTKAQPSAQSLLNAWLSLELLKPIELPAIEDLQPPGQTRVEFVETPIEPWRDPEWQRRENEKALRWTIILGECAIGRITSELLKRFDDPYKDEGDYPEDEARGAVAVLSLDEFGRLAAGQSFLAAFPWSAGMVLANRLNALPEFPAAEKRLLTELEQRLLRQDAKGAVLPLTRDLLLDTWKWLKTELQLSEVHIPSAGFAIRVPLKSDATEVSEPTFLNSFYLQDIMRVRASVANGELPVSAPLSRFLAGRNGRDRFDVVKRLDLVREALAPKRHSRARWPARRMNNGCRPALALMQQFAVNQIAAETEDYRLFSINGPPGTGKTTLLRDLVAHAVCERAKVMVKFADPTAAFTEVEDSSYPAGNSSWDLYELDKSLCGHEIVVASANNAAVENISKELPLAGALADDLVPPLQYFYDIAAELAKGPPDKRDKSEKEIPKVWGLAAAVLGNSANRNFFADTFWWNKPTGLKEKLYQARCQTSGPTKSGTSPASTWQEAVAGFNRALKSVEADLQQLEEARAALANESGLRAALEKAEKQVAECADNFKKAEEEFQTASHATSRARELLQLAEADLKEHAARKGPWWRVLFARSIRRQWREERDKRASVCTELRESLREALVLENECETRFGQIKSVQNETKARSAQCHEALRAAERTIECAKRFFGEPLADDRFWNQPVDVLQKSTPWLNRAVQEKRDAVFAAAVRVHEAFFYAAAMPMRNNLGLLFSELFKGRPLRAEHAKYVGSVWSSLFLVVPVVSTTFASVERMLRHVGAGTFGWLCIDEAGQAEPQQTLGALWRARRAVVVGDPLQIPPVVTIPPALSAAICMTWGVEAGAWAAPETSAQILADRANPLGTDMLTERSEAWVGCPLRVHRRCESPMFEIANHIAYHGLMVSAVENGRSSIGDVLGNSTWIDVVGPGSDKWSVAEGEALRQMLRKLKNGGVVKPDLYIIAPFRRVAAGVVQVIESSPDLKPWLLHDKKKRIGTVHTFQGKEAEAVILVLGAQGQEFAGSRRWAARPPNIINVAVTRAKRRLYVIGSEFDWANCGAVDFVIKFMPARQIGAPERPNIALR